MPCWSSYKTLSERARTSDRRSTGACKAEPSPRQARLRRRNSIIVHTLKRQLLVKATPPQQHHYVHSEETVPSAIRQGPRRRLRRERGGREDGRRARRQRQRSDSVGESRRAGCARESMPVAVRWSKAMLSLSLSGGSARKSMPLRQGRCRVVESDALSLSLSLPGSLPGRHGRVREPQLRRWFRRRSCRPWWSRP